MAIKSVSKNLLISLLILASVFLFSQISKSYDDKTTHPGLTDEIVDFYNLSFPNEQLTSEEKEWIVQGSIDEDTPPRWINHFYDPIYKEGWSGDKAGIWPQMVIQYFSGGIISSHEPVSSLYWLHAQDLQAQYGQYKGNRTWERAIFEAANGNKKEAYFTLGFILHLIEDATVPDHTRNDTHAHELRWETGDYGSPYEEFSKQYSRKTLDIAKDFKNKNEQPITKPKIDDYLISLAEYSNKYFFSKDTIGDTNYDGTKTNAKYEFPKIVKTDESFGYGRDENGIEYPLARMEFIKDKETKQTNIVYTLKDKEERYILLSYFSHLSRQAVLNGAGIINLFKQEAAKAEKEKLQKLPQESSSVFSPTGRLYQFTNFLSGAYNSLTNFVGNFNIPVFNFVSNFSNSLSSNIISAFNNNRQSLTTSSFLLLQNSLQEQSSPALALVSQPTPPTPNNADAAQQTTNQPVPTPTPAFNPPANQLGSDAAKLEKPQPITPTNQTNQLASNTQNPNAVPWPGFVFAAPPSPAELPQEEIDNQQKAASDESASESKSGPEPEPQDTTPPTKPQITSHRNNQYLNKSADEVPDEPAASETDEVPDEPVEPPAESDKSQYQNGVQITLKGTADNDSKILISQTVQNLNLDVPRPSEINPDAEGNFQLQITLQEGKNQLEIKARDQAGNESEAETLTLILDTAPPQVIAGLAAETGQNRGEIKITFTKSDEINLKEYEIYYAQKPLVKENPQENEVALVDAEKLIIQPSGQNQEEATITDLDPSKKYYFAAKSKDLAENVSEISNIASANPSAKAEHLVISEFKIDGGNSEPNDEFIEFYNPTGQDVSLDGWSIQYLGSGAKFENIDKKNFESGDKIPANGFFLAAKNNGYRGSTPPDMSHNSFSLSKDGGAIFLVASREKIKTTGDYSIADRVGYIRPGLLKNTPHKIYPETNPLLLILPNYYSSAAFERKAFKNSTAESLRDQSRDAFSGNAYDTDDNQEDFVFQDNQNPQNSASLPEPKDGFWNIKLAASPWPAAFYDQKGSRRSPNAGPERNPKILWQKELGDDNLKTPALSADNILYILSRTSLFLLNSFDGQLIKQTKITNSDKTYGPKDYVSYYPILSPVIDNFGTAYFSFKSTYNVMPGLGAATRAGKIRFLKENGGEYSVSSPMIGQGTIYQTPSSSMEILTAIYPDGSKKWAYEPKEAYGYYNSEPRMDENENFYLRSYMTSWGAVIGKLSIVDKNGNLLNQAPMSGRLTATKCTLLTENYYFECGYDSLYSYGNLNIYDKNGKLLLSERSPADYTSTVTQIKENEIIISANQYGYANRGRLYSYSILPNPESIPKSADQYGVASDKIKLQYNWSFELPENKAVTIPIVDGQGIIYFADSGGKVYAFDPSKGEIDSKTKKISDGAVLWTLDLGLAENDKIWNSNNLILDDKGVLCAVTEKGKVFAIGEDLTPPPPPAPPAEPAPAEPAPPAN